MRLIYFGSTVTTFDKPHSWNVRGAWRNWHIEQHGKRFFEQICARDLEGIVAKRKLSIYKDDGDGWLKIKNPAYSLADGRHELLTRRASNAQK
jgi:hypothetical protein